VRFEPQQGVCSQGIRHRQVADHAFQLSDAGFVLLQAAVAYTRLLRRAQMCLAPPEDQSGMPLRLARSLGCGLPGPDLAHHLQRERTGEATSFESQGCGLLSLMKAA